MSCECANNKNLDNKVLHLETMKNIPIDEIINMYREGYRLEDLEQGKHNLGQGGYGINYLDIKSLTVAYPNIIDASGYADSPTGPTHEILLYSNSGTYGYVHLEAYTGVTVLAEIKECVNAFVTLYRLSVFSPISGVQNNVLFRAKACDTTTQQNCTPTPPTCSSESITSTFLEGVFARARNTTPPATPTGLTITPRDGELALTWNSVSDPDGSGEVFAYEVNVTASGFQAFGYRQSGTQGRTVTIWGLTNGTTYNVSVKALTHNGVLGSAITGTGTPVAQAPANITATVITAIPTIPCLEGTCTVDVSVTWQNIGDIAGSFIPNISIDGNPITPIYSSESVGAGLTTTHTFVVSGLTKEGSPHTICPVPN